MVLSFRRLFMPPLFPVDIRDADHAGQSSLQLVGHTEFGDLKFPALELQGHPSGTFAILDGPCWRGHVRPLRQDQRRRAVSQRSGRKSGFGFRASQRVFVQNPRYWTEWTETRKIPASKSTCKCMTSARINTVH